jgi:outer membrane protein assembly factor BamB
LGALALAGWAQNPPTPARDVDFTAFDANAPAQQMVLTLEKAVKDQPLTLHVWKRGEALGMAWAETPATPAYCFVAQANYAGFYNLPDQPLTLKDGKLSGSVFLGTAKRYDITATVKDNAITGAFEGTAGKGTLTGKVLSEADLRIAENILPAKAAYPCWRNDGSGVGYETGAKLVTDLSQARIAWKSECLVTPPYHEGINFGSKPCALQGGHASPVLADGRLYVSTFVGAAGVAYDKGMVDAAMPQAGFIPRAMAEKKFATLADQIVLCIDAQTGQTLWQAVFPKDGPNITGIGRTGLTRPSSKAASHLTPCVGEGKVFAKGTGSGLYCLDAKTGAVIWSKPGNTTARNPSAGTDACLYGDGVFACAAEGGLTGYAAADGKKLWTVKTSFSRGQCTIRWTCEGKDYFITPRGQLIEPKTGKVLWTTEPPIADGVIAAGDGYLVNGGTKTITAYKITPEKAEKVWSTDKYGVWRTIHPAIYKDHLWVRAVTPEGAKTSSARTYCFELATGVLKGEASGTKSFASVTAGDGLLFNCNAALVIAQKADPTAFADLKASKGGPNGNVADVSMPIILQGTPETTGIYADGRFFTRTFDGIICFDLRAPKE